MDYFLNCVIGKGGGISGGKGGGISGVWGGGGVDGFKKNYIFLKWS